MKTQRNTIGYSSALWSSAGSPAKYRAVLTALFFAAFMLVVSGVQAGITITTEGPGAGDGDTIICGQPVTFNVNLLNDAGEDLVGITNGFRIYSPTGATWQTPTYDTAGGLDNYFDLVLLLQGFSVDGSGADTIALGGASMMSPNLPNGYDDVILRINTQMAPSSDGDTICIDSSFYPPGGSWRWATTTGSVEPGWDGPHCYKVVPSASISGIKFHDENGNSVWDGGETPLDNVTIKLHGSLDAGGTVDLTTVTDAQGDYLFSGLSPGDYYVLEEVESWWAAQTYPLTVFHTILDVQWGDNLTGYNFGNDTLCEGSTSFVTCLHGTDDNFTGPEPSYQSPGLIAFLSQQYDYIDNFDEPANNQHFGHTFNGCWDDNCVVVGATLRMSLRATGGGSATDWMYLGDFTQGSPNWRVYSISLNDLDAYNGGDGIWVNGEEMIVTLDLENLPPRGWLPTNILSTLQNGDLDIIFGDETEVDYFELSVELCCPDTCYADGDANGDGITLTVGDLAYLTDFIHGNGLAPVPLYSCDLTGDGYVNQADIDLYTNYFIYGMSVFTNGYPVPCPCDPIAEPVPDTISIFGLEHTSLGGTCLEEVGGKMVVTRFMNNLIPEGITVDIPDAISAPSSITWQGEMKDPDSDSSLDLGASIQVQFSGVIGGEPDQDMGYLKATKVADEEWELTADFGADYYTVEAYNGSDLVFSQEGIEAQDLSNSQDKKFVPKVRWPWDWGTGGHNRFVRRRECGRWKTSSDLLVDKYEYGNSPDSGIFNWEDQGVSDLTITHIIIIPEAPSTDTIPLSSVSITVQDIDSITIVSESIGFNYGDVLVSNLGNAMFEIDDTTLIVSNIGSSGEDGMRCEPEDGDYPEDLIYRTEVTVENPDSDGSLPVGGAVTCVNSVDFTEVYRRRIACTMTKAAANTWDLSVDFAEIGPFTIQAFNGGALEFTAEGVSDPSLGYIVESAKGVHPVGFKGSSTGKPAGRVASVAFDYTLNPDGVQWTCAAQGVNDLQVDQITVTTDTPDPDMGGIASFSMTGMNPAKYDMSFTILNLEVIVGCCIGDRGNVDGDPADEINIADLTYLVAYLFTGGPPPPCMEEADVNGDGEINIADLTYLVAYLFTGGPPPVVCGYNPKDVPVGKVTRTDISINANYENGQTIISIESPIDLRGLQIELDGTQYSEPISLVGDGLEVVSGVVAGTTRIGILDLDGPAFVNKGASALVRLDGEYEITDALVSDMNHTTFAPSIIAAQKEANLPMEFTLGQNYPNPFNPTTEIGFNLPNAGQVSLEIFNITGQKVRSLVDGYREAGVHTVTWDGTGNRGNKVSSGVYFYRLQADDFSDTRKMVLLK
ncbi:MAG: T9SS type A sorting domain-containing protein [candidate division Zixibacteria bacterium]|nr:T9SS type A sorting domain-containing protein [candidate division Zixibacteria bacterium]